MRILLSAMIVLAAFAASAPTASASCIDTNPDDNGVGTTNCSGVPIVGNCHVLRYGQLPGLSHGCAPIDCVQDCDGPADSAASIQGPCSSDLNPTDDNGIGTTCSYGGIRCSVGALAFGAWLQEPPVGYSCQLPIYCVRECGPPMDSASAALPCSASVDAGALSASATCPVSFCEVGPVVTGGRYDHVLDCWSPLVCVTEPCPGSGRIQI